MPVFQTLRYRLLLTYLVVLASILGVFAIAVRVVFTFALSQQATEKLVALGQGAATSLELEDGHLNFHSDFPVQSLIDRDQTLEWFDSQGRSMGKQGRYGLTLPFAGKDKEAVQIQASGVDWTSNTAPQPKRVDRFLGSIATIRLLACCTSHRHWFHRRHPHQGLQ